MDGSAGRRGGATRRARADNIVHDINSAEGRTVAVDVETARLLDYAEQLFELSGGKFDITSGVLRSVWRFDGSDRVPAPAAVHALLAKIGWRKATWQAPELTLLPGMQIDLGGIGKEYALDRTAALVREVCSDCLSSFGGDLLALGRRLADGRGASASNALQASRPRRPQSISNAVRLQRAAMRAGICASTASATAIFSIPPRAGGRACAAVGNGGRAHLQPSRYASDTRVAARRGGRGPPRRTGRAVLGSTLMARSYSLVP